MPQCLMKLAVLEFDLGKRFRNHGEIDFEALNIIQCASHGRGGLGRVSTPPLAESEVEEASVIVMLRLQDGLEVFYRLRIIMGHKIKSSPQIYGQLVCR